MKRTALLLSLLTSAALALTGGAAANPALFQSFTLKGKSAVFKAKLAEEFPNAQIPSKEGNVCSSSEHSPEGPISYCFVEFTTGERTWNLAEGSVTIDLVAGTGLSVRLYSHTAWQRRWKRCKLGTRAPGKLFSNDDCGRGQPLQPNNVYTDRDIIEFQAWPKIRSHKRLRSVSRHFIYTDQFPVLAVFHVSKRHNVYTFTNALGDSFRYRPFAGRA